MRHSLFRFDQPDSRFELLENERGTPEDSASAPPEAVHIPNTMPENLDEAERQLKTVFRAPQNSDLVLRKFSIGGQVGGLMAFLNGMAEGRRIDDFLLTPALDRQLPHPIRPFSAEILQREVFPLCESKTERDFSEIVSAITDGQTAVFWEGAEACLLFDTRGYCMRSVGEPFNEPVVLGPHEAFTENLRTNLTLLRRILRVPHFVSELLPSGGRNGTRLALCYVEGVVNRSLLTEVKARLKRIDTDALLSIGAVEQRIEDCPWLPLPQTLKTERPDRVASAIADGRVALLLEGSPIACVLPVTLGMLFASAEDAAVRRPVGTLLRIVRGAGALLSIWMPAYFLALSEHHAGQLSGEVLSVVLSSHIMVFLPLPIEMIFLLLVFQLVREAGVRVPGVVGHAIGIIGGLLLGQAAVAAHLVSTVVLIIVALSGLGNFTIPDYSTQICVAYYRVALCIAATFGGFLGIGTLSLVTIAVLCSVKSFGVPMLAPFAPAARSVRPFLVRGRLKSRGPQDSSNAEGRL